MKASAGEPAVAQLAGSVTRFDPVVLDRRSDWVIVYRDMNPTVGAALVCSKLLVRVAHVEAGLRSVDGTMLEEKANSQTEQKLG